MALISDGCLWQETQDYAAIEHNIERIRRRERRGKGVRA